MPFSKEQLHTIADIYALPDGQRAELINGQLFDMVPAKYILLRLPFF